MWKKKNCIKGKSHHKSINFAKEYKLQLKKKKRQAKINEHLGDLIQVSSASQLRSMKSGRICWFHHSSSYCGN